jgi:hypothetical protein
MKSTYGAAVDQIIVAAKSVGIKIAHMRLSLAYEDSSIEVIPSGRPDGTGPATEILRALAATNLRTGQPYPMDDPQYVVLTGYVPALDMDVAVITRLKPAAR